jgi:hypothetical protein
MILETWLKELQAAHTEEEVVSFARAQMARIRGTGRIAPDIEQHALDDGNDIRELAACLARVPWAPTDERSEADLDQHMLLLFSLATDRLSQLEGRGAVRRAPQRSIPLG